MKSSLVLFCVALMVLSVKAASVVEPADNKHLVHNNIVVREDTLTTTFTGLRACTASLCRAICNSLGFPNGICISSTECFCWR